MSALWVIALGASVGYLIFKKQAIESNLEHAVREWQKDDKTSEPAPPNGANMQEIRKAWKYTDDVQNRHFDERLPASDRQVALKAEASAEQQVQAFDQAAGPSVPKIEGVWLESYAF
jgi:hypothetical protein